MPLEIKNRRPLMIRFVSDTINPPPALIADVRIALASITHLIGYNFYSTNEYSFVNEQLYQAAPVFSPKALKDLLDDATKNISNIVLHYANGFSVSLDPTKDKGGSMEETSTTALLACVEIEHNMSQQ